MTGYTSGKTHHDPEPWRVATGKHEGRYSALSMIPETHAMICEAPRPEYDNRNPILVHMRGIQRTMGKKKSWKTAPFAASLIESIDNGWKHSAATPEHIDHARRVLARLAALTTTRTE